MGCVRDVGGVGGVSEGALLPAAIELFASATQNIGIKGLFVVNQGF